MLGNYPHCRNPPILPLRFSVYRAGIEAAEREIHDKSPFFLYSWALFSCLVVPSAPLLINPTLRTSLQPQRVPCRRGQGRRRTPPVSRYARPASRFPFCGLVRDRHSKSVDNSIFFRFVFLARARQSKSARAIFFRFVFLSELAN